LDFKEAEIAFFDMDHTLFDNDCDLSWKQFMVAEGLAPDDECDAAWDYWLRYVDGKLPVTEFLEFQLRQFKGKTPEEMIPLVERHYSERVQGREYPQAMEAVAMYREMGIPIVMLTATNLPVSDAVRRGVGLDDTIGTRMELDASGRYTGRIDGDYCYLEGKVERAEAFCAERGLSLDRAVYYGDSQADIPMLRRAARAIAVNPKAPLLQEAKQRGWTIVNWELPD
jgi:HAD superfamily hydrolase (TIGR01490 family)